MTIQEPKISDQEETKVVHLELLQGGKQPPKKGNNWLKTDINQWAVFVARNSYISKVDGFLFQLRDKYDNVAVLICHIAKEPEPFARYVVMKDFSDDYELMDILDNGEQGDRSNLNRGLAINEDLKQDDTLA